MITFDDLPPGDELTCGELVELSRRFFETLHASGLPLEERMKQRAAILKETPARPPHGYACSIRFNVDFQRILDAEYAALYKRYLRGRFSHRHKGKSLKRHPFQQYPKDFVDFLRDLARSLTRLSG